MPCMAHRAGPQSCPHVAAGAARLEGCGVGGERPLSVLAPVPFTEPHLSTLPVLLTRSSPTTQPDLFTEPSPWVISTGTDIALIAGETQGPPPRRPGGSPRGESAKAVGGPRPALPQRRARPCERLRNVRPGSQRARARGHTGTPGWAPPQGHSRWAVRWILLRLFMPHLLALHPEQV